MIFCDTDLGLLTVVKVLPRRRRDVDGEALCDVRNVGVLYVKLVRRVVQIQREPVRGSDKRGGFDERAVGRYNNFDPLRYRRTSRRMGHRCAPLRPPRADDRARRPGAVRCCSVLFGAVRCCLVRARVPDRAPRRPDTCSCF
jgi:hypothetical protein